MAGAVGRGRVDWLGGSLVAQRPFFGMRFCMECEGMDVGAWRGRVGDGCVVEKQLRFWSCGPGCGVAGWSNVAHQGLDGHGEAL